MLCRILTDFEHGEAGTEDLYGLLVEIQSAWESDITAEQ